MSQDGLVGKWLRDWTRFGVFAFSTRARSWAEGYPARLATLQAATFGMLVLVLQLVLVQKPAAAVLSTVLTSAFMWPYMWSQSRDR
ncbi:hypothetical protein [Haloactinomyces albus]|uniref:Uncharacterized protein n=1 Tax=Haloactinomyces albus TaxID=1352928 RepID=A0AAE3ZET5_9ACTN|nr:hypothetical protein [Haloactinomyces albus]MDR7302239.1 hypothetical protein [Haloactinomyces albus]